jgi:diguanylate cyclase (GGDEF)-like protein
MTEEESAALEQIVEMVRSLLTAPAAVPVPDIFVSNSNVEELHTYLIEARNVIAAFSKGDFNVKVPIKGSIGGMLKNLQANLRHMTWQVQMVSKGDFTQRVDFMGEFSEAFNKMVFQMDSTLKELKAHEEKLQKITNDLRKEISVRFKIEDALRKSHKRYQELALKDPLTDINNRRHFYELAANEVKRIQRNGGVATVGMLDVDFFKKFNDTYGHIAGDTCLKIIAAKMRDLVRDIDIVARYGGEEFIIMLPQTAVQDGYRVAERLRVEIASTPIPLDKSIANVTVSIGVTELTKDTPEDLQNADDILAASIHEADSALYNAKINRNKVVIYQDIKSDK